MRNILILIITFALASCEQPLEQRLYIKTNPELPDVKCVVSNNRGDWLVDPVPGYVHVNRCYSDLDIKCSSSSYFGHTVATAGIDKVTMQMEAVHSKALFYYKPEITVPMYVKKP